MALHDLIKELVGKAVIIVTIRDREIGNLIDITDEWIKLTRTHKKGITMTSIVKIDWIISISELPYRI